LSAPVNSSNLANTPVSGRSKKKDLAVRSAAPISLTRGVPSRRDSCSFVSETWSANLNNRWAVPGICFFLAAISWAVFGQTRQHGFVNFDDDDYVYGNPEVARGLTFRGIVWAFTHVHSNNWHPLTWISHMLDCQLYGLNPAGHHLTNILLHTASAMLLFLVLRRMTGFLWRSAFVAAVFAVHPLRVESVAWVAERKDVLSGVFFMLTIAAYVHYTRRPRSPARYGLVLCLFALGLMCKPMLVTLPLVLVLLDYWPLNRTAMATAGIHPDRRDQARGQTPGRLILEKLPLFGLAVAAGVIAIIAESRSMEPFAAVSFPVRVGNALIAYTAYLGELFWPSGLAVLYPLTAGSVGASKVALSLALLSAISAGAFLLRRRHPYFLIGWLWYLIVLAPVVGILQVGSQAQADRYTYLPQIGLYIFLTWMAVELTASWRNRHWVWDGGALVVLAALIICARTQTTYWHDSEALWTRALACTANNSIAHNNLGNALLQKGAMDEAIVQFRKALEIDPNYAVAHNNLGTALFLTGHSNEAFTQLQEAVQIKPDYAAARVNLANVLLQQGNLNESITQYQKALQLEPDVPEASFHLGNALCLKGSFDEAIAQYQKALAIKPDDVEARNNLAWLLASCPQASLRNGNEAVKLSERANKLTGNANPIMLRTLAAAYAEAGRFPEAVATTQRAVLLAEAQSDSALADRIRSEMKLYQAGRPFHSQ